MIISAEIFTLLLLDALFVLFGAVAFFIALKIVWKWDMNATTPQQYALERQSFLAATLVKYIFALKLPLFFFFIFTLDSLSDILHGAMCAAGVVDAVDVGSPLLVLKLFDLYLFGFWLLLHAHDMRHMNQPYTKTKFWLFVFAFVMLVIEVGLEFDFFFSLDPAKTVDCCGVIFSSSRDSWISSLLHLKHTVLVGAFYLDLALLFIAYIRKNATLFGIFGVFFVPIALFSLVAFFGTYIYELPTHHCPFCMLQSDYRFIGYLLYALLFTGTFYAVASAFFPKTALSYMHRAVLLLGAYGVIVSAYVLLYYLKNGVWL